MTQLKRVTFGIVSSVPPTLIIGIHGKLPDDNIYRMFCCVYSTHVDSHGTLCEVSLSGRLEVPNCGRKK